ncbi:hypothetical protein [Micromonospora aurantiaca (nom. illeg.)]|uniref:hypothetical protein n=1 Tax=Micromonospora aurantiaca (nom. illeg.) TaxID=47850 RepID=UPI000827F8AB|nr:hypothetical protein [Micromonospora aurantiaca]SCL21358.1 hypothetical protein GA0070615_0052 [Micromonospora aurantiaca]
MNINLDGVWAWIQDHPTEMIGIGGAVGVLVLALLVVWVVKALRGQDLNAKASIGFGVVQAGVAFITITGVYEFFRRALDMPEVEAGLLAGFIEACVWAAVGMIYAHGKGTTTDKDGVEHPNEGFGPAGGFFWTTVTGGGLLAILGSESPTVAVGRIVVVVLGSYMWYLRLVQVTTRTGKKTRWRWTPKRAFLAMGALAPEDEDVDDDNREWQVRQLARAIRWSNGRWPFRWLGERSMVKRAETTKEDVLAEARRRYAAAHVMKTSASPDSEVMTAIIDSVQKAQQPVDEQAEAEAEREREQERERARQATEELAAVQAALTEVQQQLADERERAQQVAQQRDQEAQALRDELATLRQRLAAAPAAGAVDAAVAAVRAELDQVAAQRSEAQRTAAQRGREAEQLRAELEAVRAELAEARRSARPAAGRAAELAAELAAGVELDVEKVAQRYGVQERQARRLIGEAKKLLDAQDGALATAGGQ